MRIVVCPNLIQAEMSMVGVPISYSPRRTHPVTSRLSTGSPKPERPKGTKTRFFRSVLPAYNVLAARGVVELSVCQGWLNGECALD